MNKNNVKGAIGAFIGAILFSLPWILTYVYLNYILSILAAIIALGSLKFYKLFKGEITKKTGILITITSLISITIATFVIIPFWLILKEGYGFSTYYFRLLYSSSNFVTAIFSDYIISVLFTILGISGVIQNINKNAYQAKNDKEKAHIEDMSYDDKVKELEKVFAKYDAFSKENQVPAMLIINELNIKNKYKFIMLMEKKGIIVSPFSKAYFDKEAVKDPEKARKNFKTNIKPACTIVLSSLVVLILILLVLFSTLWYIKI